MILITGGAGFIGANFAIDWLADNEEPLINLDKLTYAGNLNNLRSIQKDPRHIFVRGDIGDESLVGSLLEKYSPRAVVNFAAESHVDRSIHGPDEFIKTNVNGTFHLLEAVRSYFGRISEDRKSAFRFLHISTDEVYGSLKPKDAPFTEESPYAPNSPYSASKAASDHLVRAYHHTYGIPVITTNCSNNYGPFQFPEKLIPLTILNALAGEAIPLYGDGQNVRDWLYVGDHCKAIREILQRGRLGQVYNIGGRNELTNLDVVTAICRLLDEFMPRPNGLHEDLIGFVKDRPGHDRRYAINASKIASELGWQPSEVFETGLRKTVSWYLENQEWVNDIKSGHYRNWIEKNYTARGN